MTILKWALIIALAVLGGAYVSYNLGMLYQHSRMAIECRDKGHSYSYVERKCLPPARPVGMIV